MKIVIVTWPFFLIFFLNEQQYKQLLFQLTLFC